jgi:hypothetical protein
MGRSFCQNRQRELNGQRAGKQVLKTKGFRCYFRQHDQGLVLNGLSCSCLNKEYALALGALPWLALEESCLQCKLPTVLEREMLQNDAILNTIVLVLLSILTSHCSRRAIALEVSLFLFSHSFSGTRSIFLALLLSS